MADMRPYPNVRALKVRNFKGIAKLDLSLDERLTLLAGVNGVGKTSIVEALLAVVTDAYAWLAGDATKDRFSPSGDLVHYGASEGKIGLELSCADDVKTDYEVEVREESIGAGKFATVRKLSLHRQAGSPRPLVVYYDQNRIGGLSESDSRLSSSKSNRAAALDTTPHALVDFKNWFFEKEGDQAREALERSDLAYQDPEVRAVHEVLKSIAGDSAVLRSRKPGGSMDRMLFLTRENGFDIPFEALSGGEQAYFLLAVDLARRLLLEFPGSSIADALGFVCIDEIELHLHPAWQREILTSLMSSFPRCQFVVSTHSPQVIGSVAARHVRLLSSDGTGRVDASQPIASKGRDSNYVLEGIMDTPEQDSRVDELFAEADQLLDARTFDKADLVLDELDKLIEGKSSKVAVRRAKCRRLRRAAE